MGTRGKMPYLPHMKVYGIEAQLKVPIWGQEYQLSCRSGVFWWVRGRLALEGEALHVCPRLRCTFCHGKHAGGLIGSDSPYLVFRFSDLYVVLEWHGG